MLAWFGNEAPENFLKDQTSMLVIFAQKYPNPFDNQMYRSQHNQEIYAQNLKMKYLIMTNSRAKLLKINIYSDLAF